MYLVRHYGVDNIAVVVSTSVLGQGLNQMQGVFCHECKA